ncbi:MAG: NAD-dependent epimerase/dehydratase family protein [Candidatus Thorarchaeota archaeon]
MMEEDSNDQLQKSRPLVLILFGLLSLFFAEVLSGSDPTWFVEAWGLVIVFPLYWAHALFLLNLAIRYHRTSLTQLYLWGVIFGLYESWITKVIWAGYLSEPGPQFGSYLGFAVGEFMVIALFWHAVFSFIIPIMVFQMVAASVGKHVKPIIGSTLMKNRKQNLTIYLIVFFVGAIFLSNSFGFNLVIVMFLLLTNLFVIFGAFQAIATKREGNVSINLLKLGRTGLTVNFGYLLLLNIVLFIGLVPERIPSLETMLLTVGFYSVVVFLLWLSPRAPEVRYPQIKPFNIRTVRTLFVTLIVSTLVVCLLAELFSRVAVFIYLAMIFAGPALFMLAIAQVFRSWISNRDRVEEEEITVKPESATVEMKRTVVVTGAAGFVGSHLVDLLLTEEFYVVGIDNLRTGKMENLSNALKNSNFEFANFDICDENLIEIVKRPVDIVFHLAAISSVKFSIENPDEVNRVNVKGTRNMLELARTCNAKRFVFSSSAAVYGNPTSLPVREDSPLNPLSPYAESKVAAEMECLSFESLYGLVPTIFRYFNVYGTRQEHSEYSGVIPIFINQGIRNEDITIEGDGEQTRSFINVEDVVRATYLGGLLESRSNEILNLSGTNSISILELANFIKERIPTSTSKIVHIDAREGDVKDSVGSMERTSKVLGFSPKVLFKSGLDRTISWFRIR